MKEWVEFFINPFEKGESDMQDIDEELKKAYEILEELNSNEEEREKIERRIMDLRSLAYAKEYEYKQGLEKGAKNKQIEIAKNLIEQCVDIDIIVNATGLTKEEIEKLNFLK